MEKLTVDNSEATCKKLQNATNKTLTTPNRASNSKKMPYLWYLKYPRIHVSKENGYPCIQVCIISKYPIIQVCKKIQYLRYPCIRIPIWKKGYPLIPKPISRNACIQWKSVSNEQFLQAFTLCCTLKIKPFCKKMFVTKTFINSQIFFERDTYSCL